MANLDELKSHIVSIMNLYPKGVKVGHFIDNFEKMIGQRIPYKDFGYGSLSYFLKREMEDVVKFVQEEKRKMLYPIPTEKSRHILDMRKDDINNKLRLSQM